MTLLFWLFGALTAMAGTVIYIDFGLTIPRHVIDGKKEPVVRNGGDLNYVSVCPGKSMTMSNDNPGQLPVQAPEILRLMSLRGELHLSRIGRC
jgi:hypothetical protein